MRYLCNRRNAFPNLWVEGPADSPGCHETDRRSPV
jgi:hypothetical protein